MTFPDQSHINRVREALWKQPEGCASVMIGAGFSSNAKKSRIGARNFPLWQDISRQLCSQLYPPCDGDRLDRAMKLFEKVLLLNQTKMPGFQLFEILIKYFPERFEDISMSMRKALISDDFVVAEEAILGLLGWLKAALRRGESIATPPEDLISFHP